MEGKGITWNHHPLSEVFFSLLNNGLAIESFDEFNYSPYDCFSHTVPVPKGFQIKHMQDKIPMVYALIAKKIG